MAQSFTQEYLQIPAVTRAYTTACVLTTAAVQLEFITPFQLYFNPDLIFKRYQQLEFITPFQLYFNPDLIFRRYQIPILPNAGGRLVQGQNSRLRLHVPVWWSPHDRIGVGHIYFFLEDVFPNQPGGKKLLVTPGILKAIFDAPEEDPNYNPLPEEQLGGPTEGAGEEGEQRADSAGGQERPQDQPDQNEQQQR
ncbi:UNVERIFIED_CONTAM: hypothetical protein FKN15_017188 [Acipenser sinensis]